ncbi:DUF4395 domain-containing protein [Aromatoleum bremense]|uniref:DUF4395 family protein n=1 Tax=Aromatoleum bremense TaxID=76115 RepID=A0ABX1NXV3_9RHOO|nr:DUF4395 domain-containing protein [Aromatoleum bremense]NMG16870.1 DUF4395 family protein [Aromatoleum bremense]QTQ33275.1 putative protein DUf4395 [Aromatoleum bremense]
MSPIFAFGERLEGYEVLVLNERAVRAAAGILFLFAIVSFMNAWLVGNFQPTRVLVVAFLADFTIRIFVNPRFAPSLIVGQWVVRRQQPEYVGAPQKRFAWAIGFVLALTMLYLVVIRHVVGPVNLIVCAACMLLLFFEAAFGICIGCKVYNWFAKDKARLCPGGACEIAPPAGSGSGLASGAIVAAFAGLVTVVAIWVSGNGPYARAASPVAADARPASLDPAEAGRCEVPAFAKAMGHEAMWKLHNNCQ